MAAKQTRWTRQQASAMVVELDASGLSLAEFSRQREIRPERLRRWRSRLGHIPTSTVPRMVELVATETSCRARVQVHCPSGHRVEVTDVDLVVGLRAALLAVAELAPAASVSAC